MLSQKDKTEWIRNLAIKEGFILAGFSRAEKLQEESERLNQWLKQGFHGEMNYMEGHFEKRTDPRQLLPGTKSIISLAFSYHTEEKQVDPEAPKISSYAYGRDYHKVVKKKLKNLVSLMLEELGDFSCRYFVDSAPVLERDLARNSGIGWIGKNTLLINPKLGSRFFLAEIFVDFELNYDQAIDDYCGTCTRCIDACPTDAIMEDGYLMDGSRCISYLTIELKADEIPQEFKGKMENWVFGCDICQDVCPWNKFSKKHTIEDFNAPTELLNMSKEDWNQMDEEKFNKLFEGSAVKRTGFSGLKRNINFIKDVD